MTVPVTFRRPVAIVIAAIVLIPLSAGCGSMLGGSAIAASTVVSSTPSVTAPSSSRTSSSPSASPALGPSASAGSPASRATGAAPSPVGDPASRDWSAVVEPGPDNGIPSPTGDLSAQFVGDQVCFVPVAGDRSCGPLAAGATPTFAVFSPDGGELLLVAGPATAAGVYVFDSADGTARVLGPTGAQDFPAGATPPGWDLSSAVWGVDGNSVLLVPRTEEASGPVLQFDLTSGAVTERLRLDATLVNGSPSLWTTQTGIAVVANSGDERGALWWFDSTGSARRIATATDPGGTTVLSSVDPLGRFAMICSRRASGAVDALALVAVDQSASVQVLPDARTCAGSVSSPDGAHLAVTTEVNGEYSLVVVGVQNRGTELTVPLSVATPSAPPYLTWNGDVIVAADVTGEWPVPSIVVRLER